MKLRILQAKFGTILTILAVILLLGGACGPSAPPSPPAPPTPPPSPTGNRPPVIASLNADPTQVTHKGNSEIRCEATDPDGDTLSYKWSATGGEILPKASPSVISWRAPDVDGKYTISVTINDGKGNTKEATTTITVVATRAPVISSVTAQPVSIRPGETSTVTCVASDPDGDPLTYEWSANGGSISGTDKIATWAAPTTMGALGSYSITVTVSDGKGGITKRSVEITVAIAEKIVTIDPKLDESGSVYSDGDMIAATRVGDDDKNRGIRAYFSFDISNLGGAQVKSAKLTFTTAETIGTPFQTLKGLWFDEVAYGTRPLRPEDYRLSEKPITAKAFESPPATEIDVTVYVTYLARVSNPRFQVRARFLAEIDGNAKADYVSFSTAKLTVTYIK